jgi:hypothetical protein
MDNSVTLADICYLLTPSEFPQIAAAAAAAAFVAGNFMNKKIYLNILRTGHFFFKENTFSQNILGRNYDHSPSKGNQGSSVNIVTRLWAR